ncbi:efflux RND transporter periplasmic adaptor subunit [Methylorubrum extorquens]
MFVRSGARVERSEPVLRLTVATHNPVGVLVTAPAAGLILDFAAVGSLVAPGLTLFQMLANAVVNVVLPDYHGPIERDSIAGCVVRYEGTPWQATLRRFEPEANQVRLQLIVDDPDGRLPLGAPVTAELAVMPTAAMVEAVYATRQAAYAECYRLPPRGAAREELGLAPSASQPPHKATIRTIAAYDPAQTFAPRRPMREPAPFQPSALLKPLPHTAQRPTLTLSSDAWRALHPASCVARLASVSDHVDAVMRIEHCLANPQAFAIIAPFTGTLCPAPGLCIGELVTPGQPLFTLSLDADALAAQCAYLEALATDNVNVAARSDARLAALGFDLVHRRTLQRLRVPFERIAVVAPLAGTVLTVDTPGGEAVAAGATLLTLMPANTTFALIDLDAAAFARLPPQVGARWVGAAPAHPNIALPVLEAQPLVNCDGLKRVRLRLPLTAALAASVRGTPLTRLLRLDDPATRRDAVVVPIDCIVPIAASSEVLLHVGPGQLRAVSIARGLVADGFVEVADGVQVGATLIRDAAFLRDEDQRLRALLAGFWDPVPRRSAPRQERTGNPLLD